MKTTYLSTVSTIHIPSLDTLAALVRRNHTTPQKETKRTTPHRVGFACLLAAFLGSCVTTELHAQVVVVPNSVTAVDGNSSVETGGGEPLRYMQIFDASQFAGSGPIRITQFANRPDAIPGPSGPRFPTLQVFVSTTTQSVAGLSTTFANNIGLDNTLVFSGPLTLATANLPGPGNTKQFDIVFPFTTPFLYNPSAGNLLIDVRISASSGATNLVRDTVSVDPNTKLIAFVGAANAQTGESFDPFVTQFAFEPPPLFTKITTGPGSDVGKSFGAAWGDYDNDGFIDLFVANQSTGGGSASHFLYHNNTNGTFRRVTNGPVAAVVSTGRGGAWGDYDNDGNLDLVLVNHDQPNILFHNNGAGSFAAVNASFVSDSVSTPGVTWVDYDNDGYLDLFRSALNNPLQRLHHNNHDGTFTQITQGAFLTAPGTYIAAAWGDYNNDGRPDLFLPNATGTNYLYRNDGGGTFTRVGAPVLNGNFNSTAAAWGDYDNDGDLDLFVSCSFNTGQESRPNLFYRNDGNGAFTSLTSLPANDPQDQGGASHGCNWGDYDNDGWLDLFVANNVGQNDFLYHNNGDGTFTKITNSIAVSDAAYTFGATWGDYDNDGFLDLFVSSNAGTNLLYHNNGNDNHWLKFRLIGTRSNRAAIGAKVRVHATINGRTFWQMREVPGGEGTLGQNSLHVHFGLGNATNVDLVRIEWPSGTVQELTNVASKQFLTVTEPGGEPQLAATQENGQVQLTLTGKQGSRYALETSTALNNWTNAGLTVTVTNQGGVVTFPAPGTTNDAQRFYRALWQ